jgi:uncharacterized protein (TIGR00251 family)
MRRVTVSVIPKASRQLVEWLSDTEAKVWVHAAPEKGKANKAVRQALAKDLSIRASQVRIVSGETSRKKIVDISA